MNRTPCLTGLFRHAAPAARLAVLAAGLSAGATNAAQAANCTDAPVSGRSYFIVNKASGLQLDVAGYSRDPGAKVIQWTPAQQGNQQWTFNQVNGAWTIRAVHSGQALDLLAWNPSDKAPIGQYTYSGYANQQWVVVPSGNAYTIASNSSKLLLTVADTNNGSPLVQRPDQQGSLLQRWYFNPVDGKCNGSSNFGSFMGSDRVLVGGGLDYRDTRWGPSTNTTDTLNKAPWDLRYSYVHSAKTAPLPSCYELCTIGCGGWWGCENMSSDGKWNTTPGLKITFPNDDNANFFKLDGQPHRLIQQWTWYQAEDLSKVQQALNKAAGRPSDQQDYRGAINNPTLLKAYLDDYRFFLKKIGTEKNIIQLEPDFWGFIRVKSGDHPNDAHWIPAAVKSASGGDCNTAQDEDSAAGLASCMIKMARRYAVNSTVGLHLSCWDINQKPESAVDGLQACIRYYKSLNAGQGDFLVGDVTDRDAGWAIQPENLGWDRGRYYQWDDATFDQFLVTIKAVTEAVGKPMILWQIPLGNENMPNTYGPRDQWGNRTAGRWKDDKVKHLFTKMDKVAAAHIVALQFGAGHNETTSTETDGGYLLWYATQYYNNLKNGSQVGKLR